GSKTPRIAQLLEGTLQHRRERFEPLILAVVREGLLYRRRNGRPIAPQEYREDQRAHPGDRFPLPRSMGRRVPRGALDGRHVARERERRPSPSRRRGTDDGPSAGGENAGTTAGRLRRSARPGEQASGG